MSAECQLRIIDTAGATQAVITDFLTLAFTRVVNEPGLIAFSLRDGHPALAYVVHNNQVEVWRKNADIGLDWGASPEFVGIIRSSARRSTIQKPLYKLFLVHLQCQHAGNGGSS